MGRPTTPHVVPDPNQVDHTTTSHVEPEVGVEPRHPLYKSGALAN